MTLLDLWRKLFKPGTYYTPPHVVERIERTQKQRRPELGNPPYRGGQQCDRR